MPYVVMRQRSRYSPLPDVIPQGRCQRRQNCPRITSYRLEAQIAQAVSDVRTLDLAIQIVAQIIPCPSVYRMSASLLNLIPGQSL